MFNTNRFSLSLLFIVALAVFFASCDKDDAQEAIQPTVEQTETQPALTSVLGKSLLPDSTSSAPCFDFVYPFSFQLGSGATATVNVPEDFELLTEDDLIVDFVYPFTVVLTDGSEVTISVFEDFIPVLEGCDEGFGGDPSDDEPGVHCDFNGIGDCFTFAFPLTVETDGVPTVFANEEELTDFLASGDSVYFTLVFPLDVVDSLGTVTTVADEEAYGQLLSSCWGSGADEVFGNCFTFNFPLDLLLDGQTIIVNDTEELAAAFTDQTVFDGFAYPFSVTLDATEEVVTVNNDDELSQLFESCN